MGGRSMLVEMVGGERRVVVQPRLGGRVDVRLGGEKESEGEAELGEFVTAVSREVRVAWVSFFESGGGVLVTCFMGEKEGRGLSSQRTSESQLLDRIGVTLKTVGSCVDHWAQHRPTAGFIDTEDYRCLGARQDLRGHGGGVGVGLAGKELSGVD